MEHFHPGKERERPQVLQIPRVQNRKDSHIKQEQDRRLLPIIYDEKKGAQYCGRVNEVTPDHRHN
jgi:hypothetical protein